MSLASVCGFAMSEPEIDGEWIQGAMLQGRTLPGNMVSILDHDVYVTPKGHFVFGLGRDAPAEVSLLMKSADGDKRRFVYRVTQREYALQRIDGVASKYVAPPPEVAERIKRDARSVREARKKISHRSDFVEGFTWPLIGPITGVYGSQRIFNGVPKRPHFGLDIAGPVGAIVIAPAAGVVTLAHGDMYYSGGTLILDHGQGISSTFIHLNKILVEPGETVKQGQGIAEVGATGRVTGPHLDWRINWRDQRLDPQLLLPPMPKPQPALGGS